METENLSKIFLAAMVFAVAFAIPILAESSATFKAIYFLGKGIAVNQSNAQDLHIIKMGAAQVTVNVTGTDIDVTVGILYFDDSKYVLKDINNGNGTSSGNIYLNNSLVGNFNLLLVSKPSDNIWAGTLTLNGNTYNAYVLEAQRKFEPHEERDKVADYCKDHPSDTNCRYKIEEFCENNPTDQRCIALVHNYCKSHLMDGRCREELKNLCQNNTAAASEEKCDAFCERFPNLCGLNATAIPCRTEECRPFVCCTGPRCIRVLPIRCGNCTTSICPTTTTTTSVTSTSSTATTTTTSESSTTTTVSSSSTTTGSPTTTTTVG